MHQIYFFTETYSHIYNSLPNEEYVHVFDTKSNTFHNAQEDARMHIKSRTPLRELNREEINRTYIKCHKRKQEMLNTDNGKHTNFKIIFASVIF